MKKNLGCLIILFISSAISGQTFPEKNDSLPFYGTEGKSSDFFKKRYLNNDLIHYLDNLNDYVTYQSETTGNFNVPEQMLFSVNGNSYRWNKYYLDGFRTDSRFYSGSSLYQPDMFTHGFEINYFNSVLNFYTDTAISNSFTIKYNTGGLGGISPFTKEMINWFHKTASERMYQTIEYRSRIDAAGAVLLNYNIKYGNKTLKQQFSADFGTRMLLDFDAGGISSFYPEDFSKIQLNGDLPFANNYLFDNTHYIINVSNRSNLYSEFYYSQNETARQNSFSLSFYGTKKSKSINYTSGLTFATHSTIHNELNFSRNVIDQDGEAFEPWYADGRMSELSHALYLTKKLTNNINFVFDGFNTFIHFTPGVTQFNNTVYAENVNLAFTPLYVYDWESAEFNSGLLDNSAGLRFQKHLSEKTILNANLDATLDGILLKGKTIIRPNWQGQVGFRVRTNKWLTMEFNFSKNRVTYNFEDIRYMSDDYLNAKIYYWKDANNDEKYQSTEKAELFSTTGGKYHQFAKNIKQPSYFAIDIPLYFKLSKHSEFSLLNTYRKYYNNITTIFNKEAENYGYFKNVNGDPVFFMNNGEKHYIIENYPSTYMTTNKFYNLFTNSPFYFSNTMKYKFESDKFLFSFAWTSYAMAGISTLGNGPLHNNLGVYSETTANPNLQYKLIGRLDQDRAYVAHVQLAWKLNNHFNFNFTGKFKDGQPFTNYNTDIVANTNGDNQIAIWDQRTKGINIFTGDFGSRKDAFFNIDFITTYKNKIAKTNYEIQLMIYNLYDFGTELTEYTFQPDNSKERYAMSLNIPRGMLLSVKVGL